MKNYWLCPEKRLAFFAGSINPPQFGHVDFIKKAVTINKIDHIFVCSQSNENPTEIEELKNRLRVMDLMLETTQAANITILSPDVFNGIHTQLYIDDIFYLLKRRQKEVYLLIDCDSFQKSADSFKLLNVTFIVGCKTKRSIEEKKLISKDLKCIFIDEIKPCSIEIIKQELTLNEIHIPMELDEYIKKSQFHQVRHECDNCN